MTFLKRNFEPNVVYLWSVLHRSPIFQDLVFAKNQYFQHAYSMLFVTILFGDNTSLIFYLPVLTKYNGIYLNPNGYGSVSVSFTYRTSQVPYKSKMGFLVSIIKIIRSRLNLLDLPG